MRSLAWPSPVDGLCHARIRVWIVQQFVCKPHNLVLFYAGKLRRSGSDGLRALRLAAHDKDGLTEGRCFLLQSAGIRHDHITAGNEIVHFLHIDRVDQVDAVMAA